MSTKLDKYLEEAAAAAQAAAKYDASGLPDVASEYRKIEKLWRSLAEGARRRETMRAMGAI